MTTITEDGLTVTIRPHQDPDLDPEDLEDAAPGERPWPGTVAYVTISDTDVPVDQPPYGSTQGDGSAEDIAWRRYNLAEEEAMRARLAAAMPVISRVTSGEPGRWTFSRYAGCTCPCSPGLCAARNLTVDGQTVDVWVSPAKES